MGRAGRVAAKGSLAAVGGVAGLVAGTVNRPIKESIATYKEGQWSVPEYRKASLRRDTEKARGANKTNQASSAGEKSS
jgi:hypothetical protein